ncbi:NAD(P)H-binding protein [Litorihabitans aurantiacus]|uniref:NmrA family transcriptional regulator n=1 Tax=Litorihabitans aurantiacus TaxID=1930061 RepID=A0AA37XDM5_9MICO|nr:NAD(P)H-binding protein [Litorihabitans aurantiacus]GMA30137.1 NmrA family transcriptional regulator [Litorihabitans aurantiacus]
MNDTILVTGATGKTGGRITDLLRSQGQEVRAVSRSTSLPFDWRDPDTWPGALDGVKAVYVVPASLHDPDTLDQLRDFGKLAIQHGATRAVLASVPDDGSEAFQAVRDAEQALASSGLDLTVLRFRWFMQTFSEDFLASYVTSGELRLPAGEGGEAFIDADDIAAVAATALTQDGHAGREYELTGPRALTFQDAARELSAATGRTITYTAVSAEDYEKEQEERGEPKEGVDLLVDLYAAIATGDLGNTTTHVHDVLARAPHDFHDFANRAAHDGAWNGR